MKLKDQSVEILGTTYKIMIVDSIPSKENRDHEILGETDYSNHTIKVARYCNGVKQSTTEMEITYLHEIFHMLFSIGQYGSCNDDEPLVEWLARCTLQLLKKKII